MGELITQKVNSKIHEFQTAKPEIPMLLSERFEMFVSDPVNTLRSMLPSLWGGLLMIVVGSFFISALNQFAQQVSNHA